MGVSPLIWNQFILILCSILVVSLTFQPNLIKTYGFKLSVQRRKLMLSAFQFSITICSAFYYPCASAITRSTRDDIICSSPPTPLNPWQAPPRPFASPFPPTYGQPHTPLRHVHSGPSMVHQCQSQQYQLYTAYLGSYLSASSYPISPWPSAFPHYQEFERQPHDHLRRTYTPKYPRADDPTESQDDRNCEPTESCKRDNSEPDNVGETVH